ncbi:MAG: glycosyltransferase family 2 protein [Anaerolineae bacterium]|nr:glycosyltransferase family 2 protein [Anaerolineae bacterium]
MIILYGIGAVLLILLLTSLLNAATFPRLKHSSESPSASVSILIPARNEARVISRTIQQLMAQIHENYEVILLDDQSSDGTGELARAVAPDDSRLKIISGLPLPAGWLGKNWACDQLSQAAQGQFLIFTDADVEWDQHALPALLSHFKQYDMLTVWPTQKTVTWGERLCVSALALAIISYLPEIMVRKSPFAIFAAANGQCLAFKREVYTQIGGHEAVRDNIVEDVALARRVKQAGKKLIMLDGNHLIRCRMYQNWPEVRNGFAKNILAGHGNSLLFLAVSTLFHWAVFILPWIWLIVDGGIFPLILVAGGLLVRAVGLWVTHQRLQDALFMPLTVILMTIIAAQSAWWQSRHGGPQWKGRTFVKNT